MALTAHAQNTSSGNGRPLSAGGVVDANNSSTTPLGIGAVFTGTSTDFTKFAGIRVFVFADRAGTLSMQYSPDGTNWDMLDDYAIAASDGQTRVVGPRGHYYRMVYTNGAVAQTAFRLQTIGYPVATNTAAQRLGDVPDAADMGLLTKSIMSGHTTAGGGAYVDVKVSPSGALSTDLGSWMGDTTATVGQKAMAASLPVAIANNQSAIPVTASGSTTNFMGQQAVTATAVALASNASKGSVCVKALSASTLPVYVGTASVTTSGATGGWELSAGDSRCYTVANSNQLYVIASSTGSTVCFDGAN